MVDFPDMSFRYSVGMYKVRFLILMGIIIASCITVPIL